MTLTSASRLGSYETLSALFTGLRGLRAIWTCFVRPKVENASRLLSAVRSFGFPVSELQPQDGADANQILQMGGEPIQIHVMSARCWRGLRPGLSRGSAAADGTHLPSRA